MSRLRPLYATCDHGLEAVLAAELESFGLESVKPGHRGVIFAGDRVDLWRVNLESRVANRVLMPIAEFPAPDSQSLYDGVARIKWTNWFDLERTFAIDASVHKSQHDNAGGVALKAKDAICDVFRDAYRKRPNVERNRPDIRINVRIDEDHCIVSMDSSGRRLHERGYRRDAGPAPLKETLAAGILKLAGWTPGEPLHDPMCGSGTFLIEAAMMAADIAPGVGRIGRGGFAFEKWKDHDSGPFGTLVDHTRRRATELEPGLFSGADTDDEAIRRAHRNAKTAGVAAAIRFARRPLAEAVASTETGCVVLNPPYGERLGRDVDLDALYAQLGHVFKHQFAGHRAWVFAGDDAPVKSIGLRPSVRVPLRNGPIPCHLMGYELYEGTKT